jgi:tetratricopeptide (TPR) repeat protein
VALVNDAVSQFAKRLTGLIAKRPGLTVGIWGEPGIGKTHTVQRLLRETPCRNLSLHATTSPTEIARATPRPTKLPVWAERTFKQALAGEHVEIATLTNAIGANLNGLAPFILHLEDLHEANEMQLEFIRALAKIIVRLKGVGLIVTSREQPPTGFETIRLEPLSSQAVQDMLKAEVSADLPIEALEWIQTRAAGNPLFSLEFFRYLARQGFVWSDGQRWRWRTPNLELMPVSVEALIEQMIGKAMSNPTLERVIQAKASLGREVQLEVWAAVAEVTLEILEGAKLELEREGILLGTEFAHPLYAEVIAHNLPTQQRQILARRAIEALEHDPEAAANFVEDAGLEPEVTFAWFKKAIQTAKRARGEVQVARFQAQAVSYAPSDERGLLALEAARYLKLRDVSQATRLAQIAVLNLPNDTESIDLLAHLLAGQGKVAQAEQILEQLSAAERSKERGFLRSLALRSLAQDHKAVIELWRSHPEIHSIQDPKILYSVAFAMTSHGMYTEAESIALPVLSAPDLESEDRCQFIGILGTIRYYQNDNAAAALLYTQALEIANNAHRDDYAAIYLSNRANARGQQGKFDEQIQDLEDSLQFFIKSGNHINVVRNKVKFADVFLDRGEYERAEEYLLESRAALGIIELDDVLIECEYRLSQLYRDWGIVNGGILAIKHAHTALKYARQAANPMKIAWCLCYAATAEARFGNPVLSEQLCAEALVLATQLGSRGQIGMARFAEGLSLEAMGQRDESIVALRGLESTLREQTLIDPAHEVGLEVDRLTEDVKSASVRLEWFEQTGQTNLANIARRYFPELASDTPRAAKIVQTKLEVFGTMQFVTENSGKPVRGQKRRELLALLLEARIAGRRELSKLETLDALYPNTDEMQAGTLLKDLVYQLREIGGSSVIVTTQNGYALGEVISDAETFLETGDTRTWRGAYLDGLEFERINQTVLETLHLALQTRAEQLLRTDPTEAARVGRLLCDADAYDLGALRLTLNALRAVKNHKTLARIYNQARGGLLEIGEVLPERWQDFLETAIGTTA